MNPKAKKILIISGITVDILITILLLVFSIILLVNMPKTKYDVQDPSTFIGWFEAEPIRILLVDVLPLSILLVVNFGVTIWYIRKTGKKEEKQVSLNDLSEEEKAALKQKILQEMMQESNESK